MYGCYVAAILKAYGGRADASRDAGTVGGVGKGACGDADQHKQSSTGTEPPGEARRGNLTDTTMLPASKGDPWAPVSSH